MKPLFRSVGPAIIVAAIVLGPGSILTSSKVGATFGLVGLPVVAVATVLMIAMVALAARLGVVYENSLCDELASRLGRGVAVAIGLTLFVLVAFFQSSNNIALIGGLEPMFGDTPLPFGVRAALLVAVNGVVIASLYLLRNLYGSIESMMKILIGLMTIAFLFNFIQIFLNPPEVVNAAAALPDATTDNRDWLALMGMIGTTFSVGGAFYQGYLVKEKGWGLSQAREGVVDSFISISVLGMVTAMILLTSWKVFYGRAEPVQFDSVGDVAKQLEPLFGSAAKIIFCLGILAGGLSSFLVNALIGGTVMSDSLGKGSKLSDKWPLHLTTSALVVGMVVAIASMARSGSTVHLITLAQALTVLGIPALAAALIYLGTRKELTGPRRVPKWMIVIASIGFCVACVSACMTASKVYQKLNTPAVAASEVSSSDLQSESEK
ncbi:NRAMP family divalent metal transporter [Planctomycetes bacterium K23_9]|uniref:Divalent metal cation transporter MntH n=1 Tax=Stieleria marina TaxID=1930275 RepID=A0A517NMP4_9BACT|nr:Divalent metal cation transporter MntH [Planctomycetes bacterium K23_9]